MASSILVPSSRLGQGCRIGLLGLGVAVFWFFTGTLTLPRWCRWFQQKKQPLTKERLLNVLDSIAKEFHLIFSELSQMALSIQRTMKSRGLADALPIEQMGAMLMEQGFEKRLEECERRVLEKEKLTKDEVEDTTERYKDEPDVSLRTKGMKQMYQDAILGVLPLLPAAKVPPGLESADIMLCILKEIQERKLELFTAIFDESNNAVLDVKSSKNGTSLPSVQLNSKLTSAAQQAENEVLEHRLTEIESVSSYRHALAFHSRSADFKGKRAQLDDSYSDKVVALMKARLRRSGTPLSKSEPPVIVVLHDKLEQAGVKELQRLISSVEDRTAKPTVCLVTLKKNDSNSVTALTELSAAIDAFQKKHSATGDLPAVFLTTTLDSFKAAELPGVSADVVNAVTPTSSAYVLFRGAEYQRWTTSVDDAMSCVNQWLELKLQSSSTTAEKCTAALTFTPPSQLKHPAQAAGKQDTCTADGFPPEREALSSSPASPPCVTEVSTSTATRSLEHEVVSTEAHVDGAEPQGHNELDLPNEADSVDASTKTKVVTS